jgi:UDP-2-acetamido-2,6-beta-L-arabino-hexul-4-ose reductase
MKRIGITGQNGFIGQHLYNTLGLFPERFGRVSFKKDFFTDESLLDEFVANCDVIVHLAGMNRSTDAGTIYTTNLLLTNQLVAALKRTDSKAHVIFSSSRQEEQDNMYGKSKKEARNILSTWASGNGSVFTGMIIPNIFGPFGKPFYNSVVATFCHQLANGDNPKIAVDAELKLMYVGELVDAILRAINESTDLPAHEVAHTSLNKVSEVLQLLTEYASAYLQNGNIPVIRNRFELNLFNTLRSYENIEERYPVSFCQHKDGRGSFTEIIRVECGGQVSFSTTFPGITRGNHFHTRKIERFAVIKGTALIQLRRIGTDEIIEFTLSGSEPAYVDIPVWYAHNISNTGNDELYTIFWINEFYNSADPDTYVETV